MDDRAAAAPGERLAKQVAARLEATGLVARVLVEPPALVGSWTTRCRTCGLSAAHPNARLDAEQVCAFCRQYARNRDRIHQYFRSLDDLRHLFDDVRAAGPRDWDCLLLFSGGKDSTYALYTLIAMGLRVMTFTFDNGFISPRALANIRNITAALGVPHVTGRVDDMPGVFRTSLERHGTVCNGCFKGLLDRSLHVADAHGIRVIVTGLSRGQIVDERLSWFHARHIYDPAEIDAQLRHGRRVYHLMDDYAGLRQQGLASTAAVERVQLVDFYRYCDATRDEIRALLTAKSAVWERPDDCGFCSSNCLINDVGVYVHLRERGYHNYESPTAWEVRLGHLSREEAAEELHDVDGTRKIEKILDGLGYTPREPRPRVQTWTVYAVPRTGPAAAIEALISPLLREVGASVELRIVDELPVTAVDDMAAGGVSPGATPLAAASLSVSPVQARQLQRGRRGIDGLWHVLDIRVAPPRQTRDLHDATSHDAAPAVAAPLDAAVLRKALLLLSIRHACLRLRIARGASGSVLRVGPPRAIPVQLVDLKDATPARRAAALAAAREQLASGGQPGAGSLCRVAGFTFGESDAPMILLAAHEWVADLESWHVLLHDLGAAYRQLALGQPAVLPFAPDAWGAFVSAQPETTMRAADGGDAREPPVLTYARVRQRVGDIDRAAWSEAPDSTRTGRAVASLMRDLERALVVALVDSGVDRRGGGQLSLDVVTPGRHLLAEPLRARATGFFHEIRTVDAPDSDVPMPIRLVWDGRLATNTPEMFTLTARTPPPATAGYMLDVRALLIDGEMELTWTFETETFTVQAIETLAARLGEHLKRAPAGAIVRSPGPR